MNHFLEGRAALKSENPSGPCLQAGNEFQPLVPQLSVNGSNPQPAEAHPDAPQIELVRRDGKIQRIIVTCTCCKRIELDCEY